MANSLDDKHGTSDKYNDPFCDPCLTKSSSRMADDLDGKHGTSDEYNDPFCDPCFEGKGLNVKVHGYCKDCFQFLCSDCHLTHGKLQVSRHHVILKGTSMPKSQADKPPKFEYCDHHPKLVKDRFCSAHRTLICPCATDHRYCFAKTVADACKTVKPSETNFLYEAVKALYDQGKSILLSVQANIKKVREQKKQMLKEAQELYEKVIAKVNKLFQDMQSEIDTAYQSQALVWSQHQERIDELVSRLESSLNDIEKIRGKPVNTKMFLKLQESVIDTNKIAGELKSLNIALVFMDLALNPSKTIEEFLSATFTLGLVSKSDTKPGTNIVVHEILFPGFVSLKQIKAVRECTYKVKGMEDKYSCNITGLAIAKDGRRLMTDHNNGNVKMFSQDMKFLSSVLLPGSPRDIAVISEREAVVPIYKESLVILDISGRPLSIKTTIQLPYDVRGISRYNNKLVVTSLYSKPRSVKLIDKTGRIYWSVSSDQQGQPLFSWPRYVSSHGGGRSSTVIVTDEGNQTLTLLNGDTGEVITRRQLKDKSPTEVTIDSYGNVYVSYHQTTEVAVLSRDLSEEKILLSEPGLMKMLSRQDGLGGKPGAIVYDDITHQLIIAYFIQDTVDCFKLSY